MTNNREEQIYKAADKATYQTPPQYSELVHKSRKAMCAYEVGFIDGCVWADQHPKWIPVEERLPEPNIYKEGKTFPLVLVCLNDGCVDTDAYDTDTKTWCKYDGEVAYWMSLPQPPRKEG